MNDDFDLSRLAQAHAQAQSASGAVCTLLHALFPPGAAVRWVYAGRPYEGVVVEGSGPEWGHRLPVRLNDLGRVVHVTAPAILRARAA